MRSSESGCGEQASNQSSDEFLHFYTPVIRTIKLNIYYSCEPVPLTQSNYKWLTFIFKKIYIFLIELELTRK